ncbi:MULTISPECIES: SulP family inorganic anion transporter [unclassified Pseudomonas]|uniref:SulP family inorganic anion transporter n=1 Tax=unclassified Pseudomonas TaxID=196821 RepID=UPI0023E44820|nr:SulP family inorganic anion transporter [Pseudomonas sp. D3]WET09000.1 SulP family inorganic anion transporter [Pseudomonas sp. D3]
MIAIREAWKAGLLGREHWLRNIVSGVIVGVVALPLAMAFAIASGVKPEQGIYTAIVGGLLVSLFGGSRLQIAGPTGAFIVILASVTAKYGVDGLQVATMMAGAILLLLGITKLGALIKFIPDPVIVGFTAGIGVIIWVGQWKDFLGLPKISGEHFHERLWHLIQAFPNLHVPTTLLALLSLALVVLTPRLPGVKRVPGPLIAMVVVTALHAYFQFDGVATIGSAFGGIPQGLPKIGLPQITLPQVIELIGPAFAIAMLGAIESLLSAVVADGMAGTKHDSNQELIGQGIANLVTPLFGGFAATGAIARTATNVRNGGNSPIAGFTHALTLILLIFFLAPLASDIPLCALAAILFVVAYNMSELKHFKRMVKRAPKADVAILLITFGLTVFSDLTIAVNIGVILAMLQFMRRMASSVEVQLMVEKELEVELRMNGHTHLPTGVLVYTIEGPLFFGAAETLERALAQTHTDPETLIIRLKRVPFMDITGLQTLLEVIEQLQKRNIVVKLCEANEKVLGKLDKAGILQALGSQHYHADFSGALVSHVPTNETQD